MTDFPSFLADVLSGAPVVEGELERAGVPVAPDLEIPVLWVAGIGHAIVETFDRMTPRQRHDVFTAVEQHLSTGSELLQTAITTGLLEVVSEAVNTGRLDADEVAVLLGQESRSYVDAWDEFSLGRSTLEPTNVPPDVRPAPATDAAATPARSRRRPRWPRRRSCR